MQKMQTLAMQLEKFKKKDDILFSSISSAFDQYDAKWIMVEGEDIPGQGDVEYLHNWNKTKSIDDLKAICF